ncbi:MAG: amidohydrolase family protein [Nitriliruptorales bacterium]|nr:amidohydrolase family protein [Nitriliruptorales bacterium]
MPVTDLHAHIIVADSLRAMHDAHPEVGPELLEEEDGYYLRYPGRERLGPMPPQMFDVDARISEMDRQRVDVQILAVPPPQFHYHVPTEPGVDFARMQNDGMISTAQKHPDRFQVFATLPLQDIDASLAEIERVAANPVVRGVELGSNVNGANLDHGSLEPLWTELEDRDLPAWFHPDQRSIAGADRIRSYYLQNFIGIPLESTIAIASLIFGGVPKRHPDLRFGFVHGGGFAPYQVGRFDHGWGCRPEPKANIDVPPSEYFHELYFDSLTHDALSLEMLGRRVGWDHVVLGSDYPFDMANTDPVTAVEVLGLPEEDLRAVLEDNAERFLRPVTGAASMAG